MRHVPFESSLKKVLLVEVTGLYRENNWVIKRKPPQANLFYILAHVPSDSPNQFFVMRQATVNDLIEGTLQRLNRPDDYKVTGFIWREAFPHENAWSILPQ